MMTTQTSCKTIGNMKLAANAAGAALHRLSRRAPHPHQQLAVCGTLQTPHTPSPCYRLPPPLRGMLSAIAAVGAGTALPRQPGM